MCEPFLVLLGRRRIPALPRPTLATRSEKPLAALGGGAGTARVIVDHDDLVLRPAQFPGTPGQVVLPEQALGGADRLDQR